MEYKTFFQGTTLLLLLLNFYPMVAQDKDTQDLDAQESSLSSISMFTASGSLEPLKLELNRGLDAGLTINEIKEALVQLYAYCGFPRSLNAINTFRSVMEERKAKGIEDQEGKPIIQNNVPDKYEQGRKILEEITQMPQARPAPGFGEFAPRVDVFLKEHLFADVFSSDVLSYKQRELVTVSALAAMEGVSPQLRSHVGVARNTGVTQAELEGIANLVAENYGNDQANILWDAIGKYKKPSATTDLMVRIAEIEVFPEHLDAYLVYAKDVALASMQNEPGVISIFPMQTKENPNLIRIIEIYLNKEVYDAHIASTHFQKYKTSTPHMIKDLKLVDMDMLAPENLGPIFKRNQLMAKE